MLTGHPGRYGVSVPQRHLIVLCAIASQIAISLVQFGLPALTLALRDDRGVSTVEFAFLFGATGVGPAVALIAAGRLCDRIGARPVLIGGSIIGATGLTVAGFAPTLPVMSAALLISGIGAAAVPVAGMTAILNHFPPARRGRILGLRQMAVPVGGFVAAGLLPILYHVGGLELAFSVPAVLVLAFGFLFAYAAGPGERQLDLPPMRASFPVPLRWVMVTGALYVTTLGGVLTFTVSAAHDAGMSETGAAIVFAALNLGAAAARVVWGFAADRAGGSRRVATLSALGLLGAATVIPFPYALRAGVVPGVIAAVLLAFGTLGFNGIVYVIAGEVAGRSAGVAVGAASTVVFLMGSITPPALGVLAEKSGFGVMFATLALFCVAGALTARRIAHGAYTPA
jgi:MFS family permease